MADLAALEDAGLNASATPETLLLDGWLLRFCPAKVKRSRCINALAAGRRPIAERLARARALYAERKLPLFVRITPFVPAGLDEELAALGLHSIDDTRVMQCAALDPAQTAREREVVGLYEVFTAPHMRGRGLSQALCAQVLGRAAQAGAQRAYLQVESDNLPARSVYQRLGFTDAYSYHYRTNEPAA